MLGRLRALSGGPVGGTSRHDGSPGTPGLEGESKLISTFMLEQRELTEQAPSTPLSSPEVPPIRRVRGTEELGMRTLANSGNNVFSLCYYDTHW